ncbi:MAG TPA: efflux RND transporter periplasmic adaptor subunit [Methylocella sp.]|nr:efflux RND transporter periplasmic adaptor subunit [Methylocella sp.]
MTSGRDPTTMLDAPGVKEPTPGESDIGKPERGKFQSKSGKQLLGLAAFLLLAGALAYGAWSHYDQYRQAIGAAQQHRDFVPSVRVGRVRESGRVLYVTWPGTILAYEQANIFARATGYVSTRNVDIGSKVRAGDVLAIIAAPDLDRQLDQARAQLIQIRAAVEQAKAVVELGRVTSGRSTKLAKENSIAIQQADTDRLTYEAEKSALAVAEANVVAQQAAVDRLVTLTGYEKVTALFDGVITGRFIDVGDLVQANANSGTSMFSMVHSNVIRIQTYVPQDQAFGLAPGVDAVVRVPEMPDRTFPGKVTMIAGALQPGTRTLLTEIDVPNPDGALTPGTYCTVELRIPRRSPSFIVPADAIIFNQNGLSVAAVQNDTVHMQKITITRDLGHEVEVADGVKNGDRLILNLPVGLQDGSKVTVRATPPEATP